MQGHAGDNRDNAKLYIWGRPSKPKIMEEYYAERGITPMTDGEIDERLRFARLLHTGELEGGVESNEELLNQLFSMLAGGAGYEGQIPPPASKDIVVNLPKVKIDGDNVLVEEKCTVCVAEYIVGDACVRLPCQHLFHVDCLKPWLSKTNSCPLCRHEMPTDDAAYEEHKKESAMKAEREANVAELHDSMYS